MAAMHFVWLLMTVMAAEADPATTGIWTATSWSPCSSPCSIGIAYRDVQCRSRLTNDLIASNLCSEDPPPRTKICSSFECQWGCKPDSLQPICLTASLQQVDDVFCNRNTHPGNFTDGFVCPYGQPKVWRSPEPNLKAASPSGSLPSYSWAILTPFSACSPRCGAHRFSWRSVTCVNSSGGIVDDLHCSGEAPPDRQPCPGAVDCRIDAGRCRSYEGDEVADYWCLNKTGISDWRVESDWSECPIPTWLMSTRRVVCQGDRNCSGSARPATTGSCPWLPPLTYYRVGQGSDLCTSACGPGIVSNSFQCRFQDLDVDNEYCRGAGVPEPIAIPCRTQSCVSNKPCSLHARLNISIPIGAFMDIAGIERQLQLDLYRTFPNATGVVVSQVSPIGAEMVEAEFTVLCNDMAVSAFDVIQMQMSDPESAFRRGLVTRGSSSSVEVLAVREDLAPQPLDAVSSDSSSAAMSSTFQTINPTTIYLALAVFVVVFAFIRVFVRKATNHAKAKARAPISTKFSVMDLETSMPPIQRTILTPAPRTTRPGSLRMAGAK